MCVSVRSLLPPHASISRNIGMYVFTATQKTLYKTEKTFKNEQRSKDAAAKKRPNTSGVGKINNYYEDIYIPPYNNTD